MAQGFPKYALILCGFCVLGLDHFAAAQAGSAHAHTLVTSLGFGLYRAQIHVPASAGHVVRVADGVSELRPFAANITNLCHDYSR